MTSSSSTPQLRSTSSSSQQVLQIQNATADMTACTFAIRNEDHTLGNVIRHTLMQNETNIEFAGYSVPHPSEPIVQIRVQTRNDNNNNKNSPTTTTATTTKHQLYTAPVALQEACDTVSKQCDIVLDQLEQLLPYVKEDRIQMEQYNMEEQNDDDEEFEDDDNEEVEVVEEDAQDDNDDDEMVEDV